MNQSRDEVSGVCTFLLNYILLCVVSSTAAFSWISVIPLKCAAVGCSEIKMQLCSR